MTKTEKQMRKIIDKSLKACFDFQHIDVKSLSSEVLLSIAMLAEHKIKQMKMELESRGQVMPSSLTPDSVLEAIDKAEVAG